MRPASATSSSVSWIAALFAVLITVYFLTAPPIIIAIIKRYGFGSQAPGLSFYKPVFSILGSDFGGPLLWYFNQVWNAKVEFLGEESYGPTYVAAFYAIIFAALVGVCVFPFYQRYRRRVL